MARSTRGYRVILEVPACIIAWRRTDNVPLYTREEAEIKQAHHEAADVEAFTIELYLNTSTKFVAKLTLWDTDTDIILHARGSIRT